MRFAFIALLAIASVAISRVAHSETPVPPSAEELLTEVARALRENSYRGRVTYEHSGRLEVVDIEHGVVDGVEHNVVRYLNGPHRRLVKSGRRADCETRGSMLFSGAAVDENGGASAKIAQSYKSKYLGSERVAGRQSWVIQMIPRDHHRHSFVLAVDQDTYLPTKTLYVAREGKPLERLHFVDLESSPKATEVNKLSEGKNEKLALIEAKACQGESTGSQTSAWRPAWVPPGFVFSAYNYSAEDGHIETYTDGLTSFSLIAKTVAEIAETAVLPGNSVHTEGATVVVMRLMANKKAPVRVSLVGEIPSATARRILSSVERAKL